MGRQQSALEMVPRTLVRAPLALEVLPPLGFVAAMTGWSPAIRLRCCSLVHRYDLLRRLGDTVSRSKMTLEP